MRTVRPAAVLFLALALLPLLMNDVFHQGRVIADGAPRDAAAAYLGRSMTRKTVQP